MRVDEEAKDASKQAEHELREVPQPKKQRKRAQHAESEQSRPATISAADSQATLILGESTPEGTPRYQVSEDGAPEIEKAATLRATAAKSKPSKDKRSEAHSGGGDAENEEEQVPETLVETDQVQSPQKSLEGDSQMVGPEDATLEMTPCNLEDRFADAA